MLLPLRKDATHEQVIAWEARKAALERRAEESPNLFVALTADKPEWSEPPFGDEHKGTETDE